MCGFVLLMDDPSSTIVGFFCTFFFCQNAPFQISIASKSKRRRTCGVREFSATVEQTSAFYCLFWNDAVLWDEGKWNNQNLRVDCGEIREGWGHWGVKIRKRTPLIYSSSFPKNEKGKRGGKGEGRKGRRQIRKWQKPIKGWPFTLSSLQFQYTLWVRSKYFLHPQSSLL